MFHVKQFEKLKQYCEENRIPFDRKVSDCFSVFYNMLLETNKVMNLTAVTEPQEVELKHFIDSLAAYEIIKEHVLTQNPDQRIRVLDIGTGAGFPGLPLAFVLPEADFVLADALNKRIGFIQSVIDKLGLSNVTAIQGRAEDLGQGHDRESFDFCVSRAVADMSVLLEYCLPMVKKNGMAILYKSGDYKTELEHAGHALEVLGGEVSEVREFHLSDSDIGRSLIMIQKVRETPAKYPRRAGKPSKSPLS